MLTGPHRFAMAFLPPHLGVPSPLAQSSSGPCALLLRMSPLAELSVPKPDERCSSLFPALDVRPSPPARSGLRLRRAVLLTVVVGAVSLLGYASWQRAAHAQAASASISLR
jgi:hypothetical protein